MHPLLSALWVGCLTNSQPQQGEYFLVDDIQVPVEFRRHASPLGAVSFTDKSRLWPMGRVNYYVDPAAMDTHDPRILGAVAHWEEHTCIRFHKCGSMSSCGPTFILFTSDGTGCNSPLGLRPDGVNRINLRFDCGLGNAIHEIAHSLGLHHEQSRNDRDSYVAVDYGQVKQGYTHNFDKTGAYGRDVGPYDYASIMHYNPASFTIGSSPSIVSPRQIGQRDGLSEGDIAAIHFLYNTCSDQFAAPKCSVSRDTARVVLVPHSKVFEVEFNAEYSRGATMTVSYAATTAPNHVASVVEGVVADSAKTKVSFTPSALQAGSTYVLAATFSANNGGGATTCEVSVKVAASDVVCFGVASDDPAVCSGRGMCTADPLHPCQCYSNFGGLECQGYATCSDNFVFSFDDADSLSHWHFDAGLDTTMSVSGGASAMFTGAGYTQPKPRGIFTKVSYHVAFSTTASVSFRGVNGVECWSVYLTSTTITLQATGVQRADITPTPRTWYFIEHVMDPVSNALTLRVDGTTYGNPLFVKHGSTCDVSGVELVAVFGQPDQPAWLDEMHLYCHSFVSMDGSLANPEQSDFTDGGLTLTIAIDGSDTWVDTPATKRALIDGFTSSYPSPSGWDALKDALLPEGLVRIAGSAVEIGPLPPAPEFYEFSSAVVTARLRPSMFASGAVPLGGRELFFRIPGICPMNTVHEFDDPTRSLTSPVAGYSTSVVASGAASMEFVKAYGGYLIRVGPKTGYLATSVSFFSRVVDASGSKHIGVDVVARDGTRIGWHTGVNNRFLSTLDNTLYGDVQSNTWYHVTMLLDWDARVVSVKVDGALLAANLPLPESFESVVSLIVYTFSVPAYLDRIVVACDGGRKPAFSVVPAQCVDPAAGFVTFKFFAGADALHPANDVVAVVDGAAGDCSFARAECAALRACSDTVGVFVATDHGVEWAAGSLASLAGAAEYKLCYYAASAREWLLLDQSFTTCEVVAPIATAWVVTGPLGFDGVDGTSQVRFTTDQGTVCLSDVVTAAPAAFSTVSFTAACARGPAEAIARVEVLTAGVAVWDVASVEFEQQPGGVLHQWLSAAWGGRNGGPLGGSRAGVALLPPAAFGGLFDVTFRAATSTVTHSASVSGFDVTFHSRDLACNGGWLADLHAGRTQAITVKCPFEAGAVDRVVVAGSEWGVGGDGWIVDSAQLRTGPNWRTLMVDGTHPPYRRMIKKATPSAVALFLVPFSIRILPSGNLPLELRTGAAEAASVAVRVLSTGGAVCTVQVPVAEITRGSIVATPACTFGGWDIDEIAVVTAAVWSWGLARLQCTGGHTGHQWQTYVSPLFGWSASAEIVEGVPAVIPFYAAAPEGLSNLLLRFTTSDVTHSATVGGISITLASYGGAACQASTMRGLLQREVTEVAALCAFAAGDLESVHVVNDSADGWIVDAVEVFSAGSWTALRVDGRGPPYNRWVKKTLAGHEDATFLWL